jgi:hypothetical protein
MDGNAHPQRFFFWSSWSDKLMSLSQKAGLVLKFEGHGALFFG